MLMPFYNTIMIYTLHYKLRSRIEFITFRASSVYGVSGREERSARRMGLTRMWIGELDWRGEHGRHSGRCGTQKI